MPRQVRNDQGEAERRDGRAWSVVLGVASAGTALVWLMAAIAGCRLLEL